MRDFDGFARDSETDADVLVRGRRATQTDARDDWTTARRLVADRLLDVEPKT